MSWHLSGQITPDQRVDERLTEITHEYKAAVPDVADDIDTAKDAAAQLLARLPEDVTRNVSMSGHKDNQSYSLGVNVYSYRAPSET